MFSGAFGKSIDFGQGCQSGGRCSPKKHGGIVNGKNNKKIQIREKAAKERIFKTVSGK